MELAKVFQTLSLQENMLAPSKDSFPNKTAGMHSTHSLLHHLQKCTLSHHGSSERLNSCTIHHTLFTPVHPKRALPMQPTDTRSPGGSDQRPKLTQERKAL